MDTKEKILSTALEMFSRRGFSAVSVRDISYAVGVKESALYNHFESKQAVFNTLVERYMRKSNEYMQSIGALGCEDAAQIDKQADLYARFSDEQFLEIGRNVFTDFLMLPEVMRFWRMISIEQYNNPDMAEIFNTLLFDCPVKFQTMLFQTLIARGALIDVEPSILAIEFYTPALMLYLRILPFEPNDKIVKESFDFFTEHMRHFRKIYSVSDQSTAC